MENVGIFNIHLVYFYNGRLVNFVIIWYIFLIFGTLQLLKSGNTGAKPKFDAAQLSIKADMHMICDGQNA
jgi:hypothetical protein